MGWWAESADLLTEGEKKGCREQNALFGTLKVEKRWAGEQRVPICSPRSEKEGCREQDALFYTPKAE